MPEVFEESMRIRQAVLGEEHVARSWLRAEEDPFLKPLQEAVTGLAWARSGAGRASTVRPRASPRSAC